jgi:[ribosomal protein S5]-alanine N-acetyltransferase
MRPPETFNTDRLIARKPRREDAAATFAAYASDPEATRYLTWKPYTEIEPVAEFLQARADDWEQEDGLFAYILCLKGTNTPIGSIGLTIADHKVLFGYVLGRAHWGHGYMTEALRYLLAWSLAQPSIYRAWAFCDVANPASARVMEKAGMVHEGIFRRFHVAPNLSPEPRDCIVYAKVR